MVHVVDGSCEEGRENLQVCEHGLEVGQQGGHRDTGVRKIGSQRDRVREMGSQER